MYGPYGGAGVGARYNPRTGTYARGAAAYGPYGARGVAQAYNPRTGTYAQTRQGSNVYGSWGSTTVQRGDDWAKTSRVTNDRTGNTTRVTQGDDGGAKVTRRTDDGRSSVARTEGGDVYAGHDGNVYRKQGDSWQKYQNGSWGDAASATPRDRQQSGRDDRSMAGTTADPAPRHLRSRGRLQWSHHESVGSGPRGAHDRRHAHSRCRQLPQRQQRRWLGRRQLSSQRRPGRWRPGRRRPAALTRDGYRMSLAGRTSAPASRISSIARGPSPGARFTARTPSSTSVTPKPRRRASRTLARTQ